MVQLRFGNPDEPGWPGPALPPDQVGQLTGSADLAELLAKDVSAGEADRILREAETLFRVAPSRLSGFLNNLSEKLKARALFEDAEIIEQRARQLSRKQE